MTHDPLHALLNTPTTARSDHYSDAAELRLIRRRFGLAIADVAQLLDVDARTINRWESGTVPLFGGVLDALHHLEQMMEDRIAQRASTIPPGTTIIMARHRSELDAMEPFYRDLPSALYEWEISALRDLLSTTATYTTKWKAAHANRAGHDQVGAVLQPGTPGRQHWRNDVALPPALRTAVDGHLGPGFTYGHPRALAHALNVSTTALAECHLTQPDPSGPTIEWLRANAEHVDGYVIDADPIHLEVTAWKDDAGHHPIGTPSHARLPWLQLHATVPA